MEIALFLKSLLLGLAVAAPLGPIGALCINRTLERGFAAGLAGGLGTALADASYATLAALGFATFSGVLAQIDTPLRVLGGLFMLWLGWRGLAPKPTGAATIPARDLLGTTAATFALTITNPMTILSFAALFAGLGLGAAEGFSGTGPVVLGVFAGSMLWWGLLSGGVALIQHRLPASASLWVARGSGAVLIGFGLWALLSALI